MSDWEDVKNAVGLKIRPIESWPSQRRWDHDHSPFKAKFRDTVALIRRELSFLSARNVVLQAAFRERDLRLDGLPRMDARPSSSGVILSFECRHGHLSLPCDTFSNWQHNLRAIGAHLENLRHASLYGVGRHGEQYKGWTAIPAKDADGFSSADEAARWIAEVACDGVCNFTGGGVLRASEVLDHAYRLAAKKLHPDAGGSHEAFTRLQDAKSLLDKHHGRAA